MSLKKFSKSRSVVVVLDHGDEEVEIVLHALPPGYSSYLRSQFKPPERIVSGVAQSNPTDPEYNDLLAYLYIGKSTERDDLLATKVGSEGWVVTARKIRDEFREADYTDGDVRALFAALNRISNLSTESKRGEGARGNSPAGSAATRS